MAAGLNDLPADQSSSPKKVLPAEVENISQEQALPTQPPPIYTPTVPSQQSPPTAGSRNWWDNSTLQAFNVFETGGDKAVLRRRICMLGILLVRIPNSILGLWSLRRAGIGFFVTLTFFTIGCFFFLAKWLAQIGEFSGRRRVFGMVIGRTHCDVFLASTFVLDFLAFIGLMIIDDLPSALVRIGMIWWAARIAARPDIDDGSIV
jgi:hypothetical protein